MDVPILMWCEKILLSAGLCGAFYDQSNLLHTISTPSFLICVTFN